LQDRGEAAAGASRERQTAGLRVGGIRANVAAKEAAKAARAEAAQTRAGVLAILREIAADEDESGAYRTAAARLLLMPEAGVELRCPLPCCANRPGNVVEWIERMAEADRIAPRKLKPEVQAWLDGLPEGKGKAGDAEFFQT